MACRPAAHPYLIFFDGDCIFPRDHLQQHLHARQPGLARTGDSYRLDRITCSRIDDATIRSGAFVALVSNEERRRLRRRWIRELFYAAIRHTHKPKVMAGNLAVWRSDFERINGFDEQFVGWGCEDDDLGHRLRQAGIRVAPIYGFTQGYHLWHPPHPSRPKQWHNGANVEYLTRRDKPTRCVVGLSAHARREAAYGQVCIANWHCGRGLRRRFSGSGPLPQSGCYSDRTSPTRRRRAIIGGWRIPPVFYILVAQAVMSTSTTTKPHTLAELRASGWQIARPSSRRSTTTSCASCRRGDELFPGIIGYDDTVIPEINIALLAQHDMLFLGEKGQAKSRLMRLLVPLSRRGDSLPRRSRASRCTTIRYRPITRRGRRLVAERARADEVPIAWWPRDDRYAERLAPGTKFADIIGEIDPAKLAGGASMSAEEALHFGLIPRMHRGIFAMNELPELDELVQVGLFNILEERDVQIRGYPDPVRHRRADSLLGQPGHLQPQRQGDSAAQGPHRLGDPHALPAGARPGHRRSWSRRPSDASFGRRVSRRASCPTS